MSQKAMQNMMEKEVEVKARKLAQLKRTGAVIETTMAIVQNADMKGMDAPEVMAVMDWLNGVKMAVDAELKLVDHKGEEIPPAVHTENGEVPVITAATKKELAEMPS